MPPAGVASRSAWPVLAAAVVAIGLAAGATRASTTPTGAGASSAPPAAGPTPVLVELFTSEGCSDCPPADRVLADLLQTQPVDGARVVGLGEHVDYWDRLGWKDPFSDRLFSVRQSAYAARDGSTNVYTPQMIVDGGAPFVGSDRQLAIEAIGRASRTPKAPIDLTWSAPHAIAVRLAGGRAAADATVALAVVEDGLTSAVKAGENAGHTLAHAAVARRFVEIGRADHTGAFSRSGLRVDPAPGWRTSALQVIVFAQAAGVRAVAAIGVLAFPSPPVAPHRTGTSDQY